MKKLLLFILIASFSKNYSQSLILTKAFNEPIIGDTSRFYVVDTSLYVSGLNIAATGSNQVWNYTNLTATSNSIVSAYVSPTTVASPPAGCTIIQKQGALNTFYKSVSSPSDQIEFQGVNSTSLSMNFTNSAISSKFPFTYGDSFTDSFSGSFTFSLSGTASGNATVTADGKGTLNLPNGVTLTNVLRVKSIQTTNLNAFIINGTIKQTIYNYYHSSQKYPVFTVNYQAITITGQTPSVTAQVLGNTNNFVVGLNENSIENVVSSVYPNPFSELLNIEIDKNNHPLEITIYNQLGEMIVKTEFVNSIDLKSLNSGIYLMELKTEKGTARKRIIKQ